MPAASAYITFNGLEIVLDPRALLAEFKSLNLSPEKFLRKANSFSLPRGKWPGKGYFLMLKSDYDALDKSAFTHYVTFNAPPDNVKVERLIIVSAENILGGAQDEGPNDVLLVEVADVRWLARLSSVDKSYNRLAPDYSNFFANTSLGGTPYTWPQMVTELYQTLPSVFNGMDYSAANAHLSAPLGFAFHGVSGWDALNRVIDHLDNVIYVDRTGKLWIINGDNSASAFTTKATAQKGELLYHGRNAGNAYSFLPEKVRVFFPSRDFSFQTSADLLEVTFNTYWLTRPFVHVDVDTSTVLPNESTAGGTVAPLVMTLQATFDPLGVAQNQAALDAEALDRATSYLNMLLKNSQAAHQIYSGAIDFSPGSKVAVVSWFDTGDGIKTELQLVSGKVITEGLPSPLAFPSGWTEVTEYPGSPDLARETKPYEHWAVASLEDEVEEFGSGNAFVLYSDMVEFVPSSKEIVVTDIYGQRYATGERVFCQYHGQALGWIIVGSAAEKLLRFELYETLDLGGSALAQIVTFNGVAYVAGGDQITVTDFTENPGSWAGLSGYRGWCVHKQDSDAYEIVWMETYARFCEFTLASAISGGEANATLDAAWHIKYPPDDIVVSDRRGWYEGAPEGATGFAIWDEIANEWVIVVCETLARMIYFTLVEDAVAPPGTFKATVEEYWDGLDPSDDDGQVELLDRGSFFQDSYANSWTPVATGYASYDPEFGIYVPIYCTGAATMLRGTFPSGVSGATADFYPTAVLGRSPDVQMPSDIPLTVHNLMGFEADSDAIGVVVWNYSAKQWELLQITCPA